MKVKYILFDLDGTIIDPKIGITKSVEYALNYLGIQVEALHTLEKFIGPPLKNSFREFYNMDENMTNQAVLKYRERFSSIGYSECELYAGMEQLLKNLKSSGFILGIASSKPTIYVEKICKMLNIDNYFSFMLGSFMDGSRSEKEEVIAEALIQLKDIDRSEIIMIGDRKFDMIGAQENQLKSIGVSYGYGGIEELEEAGADYIVHSVSDLEKILLENLIN